MPAILLCIPTPGADFAGARRNLIPGEQFGINFVKEYSQQFTVITDSPVGPEWLFSFGVDPTKIAVGVPLPSLGQFWIPSGLCEEVHDGETMCVAQEIVKGPYDGAVQHNGTTYTGCRYDCNFSFVTAQNDYIQPAPIDQPDPDPLEWLPRIQIDSVDRLVGVDNSLFLGGYEAPDGKKHACLACAPNEPPPTLQEIDSRSIPAGGGSSFPVYRRKLNTCGPVVNAVGEEYEPPPETEQKKKTITITKFKEFPKTLLFACYEDRVNKTPLRLNFPHLNFDFIFPIHTIRLVRVNERAENRVFRNGPNHPDAPFAIVNRSYWERTYELEYDPKGHYSDLLNRGLTVPNPDYDCMDPNSEPRTNIVTENTKAGRFIELVKPLLLDLQGQVLHPCTPTEAERVFYLRYLHYPEVDLAALELELIEPPPI